MKRGRKKQIREDELVSGFEKALAWAKTHQDELRIVVGVLLVVGATAGALGYFQRHRKQEADRAFEDALASFHAPVASELATAAEPPTGQVFATREDKFKTAAAGFDGVARRYGSLPVATQARYYAALSRLELGDYDLAEKALEELAAQKSAGLVPALAQLALAEAYRRSDQVEKALDTYRRFVADGPSSFPRDYALLCLAQTLEETKRLAEARAAYRRLSEEFPASVYAAEARQRVGYLQATEQG